MQIVITVLLLQIRRIVRYKLVLVFKRGSQLRLSCKFDSGKFFLGQVPDIPNLMPYYTGLPAHSWFEGITLPGGTTELGPTAQPFSSRAPSKTTLLWPTRQSSSMVQEYKVQLGWMVTKLPISTTAGSPLGRHEAVWMTVFSPMTLLLPILDLT